MTYDYVHLPVSVNNFCFMLPKYIGGFIIL